MDRVRRMPCANFPANIPFRSRRNIATKRSNQPSRRTHTIVELINLPDQFLLRTLLSATSFLRFVTPGVMLPQFKKSRTMGLVSKCLNRIPKGRPVRILIPQKPKTICSTLPTNYSNSFCPDSMDVILINMLHRLKRILKTNAASTMALRISSRKMFLLRYQLRTSFPVNIPTSNLCLIPDNGKSSSVGTLHTAPLAVQSKLVSMLKTLTLFRPRWPLISTACSALQPH